MQAITLGLLASGSLCLPPLQCCLPLCQCMLPLSQCGLRPRQYSAKCTHRLGTPSAITYGSPDASYTGCNNMMAELVHNLVRIADAVLLWCSVLMGSLEELNEMRLLVILAGMTTKGNIKDLKIHCKFGEVTALATARCALTVCGHCVMSSYVLTVRCHCMLSLVTRCVLKVCSLCAQSVLTLCSLYIHWVPALCARNSAVILS
jgi:hypothetical protein